MEIEREERNGSGYQEKQEFKAYKRRTADQDSGQPSFFI